MNCDDIKMMISDYIDNELQKEKEGFLFTHLASCRDCREEFKLQNQMQHEVKVNQKEVSGKFEERIFNSIERREKLHWFFFNKKSNKEFVTGLKIATVSVLTICAIIISLNITQDKTNKHDKIKINREVINVDDQVEMIFGNKLDQQMDEIELQLQQIKND